MSKTLNQFAARCLQELASAVEAGKVAIRREETNAPAGYKLFMRSDSDKIELLIEGLPKKDN